MRKQVALATMAPATPLRQELAASLLVLLLSTSSDHIKQFFQPRLIS